MSTFAMRFVSFLVACVALCDMTSLYAQIPPQYAIVPADPKNLESIVLQVRTFGCIASRTLRFENGTIRYEIRDGDICFPEQPPFGEDVVLGRFPAGTYSLSVQTNFAMRAALLDDTN